MKKLLYLLYVFILALLLAGCANAGKDQTVHPGDTVTLDGTKSKGKIERYEWKQISGESVTLTSQDSATATFVAPNMTTSTVLTFRLNVLEKIYGRNIRTTDYVYITVTPVEPENIPPTAHISVSQSSIYTGESVDFSGYTSTDSDGDIVSYLWKDANETTIGTSENFTYLFDHIGEYSITLIVTDDKGATDETNTTITVAQEADTTKPVIILHGNAEVNLTVGDNYIDAGATAEDDRDGNLTADINITNPVNTQVAGTYTITYNVSDTSGNAADEVHRVVYVHEVGIPVTISTHRESYTPQDTIKVAVEGTLSGDQDWAGIFRKDDNNSWSNVIAWNLVHDGNNTLDRDIKAMPEGEYEARLFFHNEHGANVVARAVHGFSVSDGGEIDYGEVGPYKDINRTAYYDKDNKKHYVVYKPSNMPDDTKMPLILMIGNYYSEGNVTDENKVRSEGLMRFMASYGYYVIGNLRKPGDNGRVLGETLYKPAIDKAIELGENIDTTSLGIIGHSLGGSLVFRTMKYMQDELDYGLRHSLVISLDGWFNFDMRKGDLAEFKADSLFILFGGLDGVTKVEDSGFSTDPRITLSTSRLLNRNTKKAFITVAPNKHLFYWGKINHVLQYKEFLKPISSSLEYILKGIDVNDTMFTKGVYEQNMTSISNHIKSKDKYTYRCDGNDSKLYNNDIDYCGDYLGNNDPYIYPPDTKLTEVGIEDLSRPEKTAFEDITKASVVDPAFGTTITRMHHQGDSGYSGYLYPKSQSWNANMTYLYLGYRLFDADTLLESPITKGLAVDSKDGKEGSFAKLGSPVSAFRWSNVYPKVFYTLQGANRANHNFTFTKNTIVGNKVEPKEIFNFQKYQFEEIQLGNGESHIDRFDKYVVFMAKKPNNDQMFVLLCNIQKPKEECKIKEPEDSIWGTVYVDDDNDGVYSARSLFDWIDISPNGDHIIVNKTVNAIDYIDKKVKSVETAIYMYDLNFTNKQKIANTGGHGDLGLDANSDQVYVQFEWREAERGIFSYNLDAPEGQRETKVLSSTYGGGHISCQNFKRPGWCYLSTNYNGGEYNEVFALKLDGNETVNRFVKARSTVGPYAGVSPDGKRVVYLSNWDEDNKSIYNIYHVGLKK